MAKQQNSTELAKQEVDLIKMASKENMEVTELTKEAIREIKAKSTEDTPEMSRGGETFGSELGNIPFKNLIAGPLTAAVEAQVASSVATVDFIKQVGFKRGGTTAAPTEELVMVAFSKQNGTETTKVEVPLLACLNIPSLQIKSVDIDFNVKLNSVDTTSTSSSLGVSAGASGGFGPVRFNVSASYQRKTASGSEVKREYSMNVKVRAEDTEIPKGLETVLGLLQ